MPVSFTREALSLAFLVVHVVVLGSARNLVLTKQGYVKGIRQDVQSYKGQVKTVYEFLGVPYAEKPIGDLRFKRPQTLKNRRLSVYDATSFRPICIQFSMQYDESIKGAWPGFNRSKDMSEDCLYLNVYTPSTNCTKKYPVIVYIHGGSFIAGTPIREGTPGELLPSRGVVLVTVQYRLGTFGFFSTGDSEAPGNVGLLDQVEALKWVQENIHGFCGDKGSVTLLGESAGGSSVSFHFLSPLAKGLFHRGIAVSGVDFSPFATTPKTAVLDASKQLAKNLDCTTKSNVEMLQCLRLFPSSAISKNAPNHPIMPFVDNHFLPDEPKILRKEGKFHKLPLMSGFVSQEGSQVLQNMKLEEFNSPGFRDYLDGFLQSQYKREKDQARIAFNALQFQYTPWADVNDAHRIRKKLVDMLTDYFIVAPTHAVLTMHSNEGAPTYMFEFSHRSKFHPKPKWMGVVHEDTSPYKFGLPLLNSPTKGKFDDDDKNVSDLMVTLFLNFAKFGDPTPTPVHGLRWDTFNSSTKAYLKINKNPVMKNKYHPLRMAFWNSYFPTLIPARSIPPSSGESKTSAAILVRGTSLVFVWCMVTVGKLLRWDE